MSAPPVHPAAPPLAFTPTAPFIHGGHTHRAVLRGWLTAAGVIATTGVVLFGFAAVQVLGVAVAAALLSDRLAAIVARRRKAGGPAHAALTGVLLALTLPPTAPWYVPLVGSVVGVVVAVWMFGGFGHYVWQPALVGRVVVQFIFAPHLSLAVGAPAVPVLAPGHLITGDIAAAYAVAPGTYRGWSGTPLPPRHQAFAFERPVQSLRRIASGELLSSGTPTPLTDTLRDYLPPWEDTVLGTQPGAIGEPCTIALVVVGLYLVYRGDLRWQVPVYTLGAAALAAAILPIALPPGGDQPPRWHWVPALIFEDGSASGAFYVVFHLTTGQLLLGAFLLAGDMLATPLTARGQMCFAIGVGVLTIAMRLHGMLDGECYWSILIMNTGVGLFDRLTRRRPLGVRAALRGR